MRSDGGLAGVFDLPGRLDVDRVRTRVGVALGVAPSEVAALPGFVVAQAGANMHRQGDLVCALEGRLSNRAQLSRTLGCPESASAAEVVSVAWSRLGERALHELRGEFVVVIWDRGTGSGLLARDQLGGRTVFVHSSGTRLTFGSDIKWLLRSLSARPGVDRVGMAQWLVLGGANGGRTLYEGIRRLPPGSLLRLDGRGSREERYWHVRYREPLDLSIDEAADALRAGIGRAVASQADDDAPVGILLSGGLDSTTVGTLASEETGRVHGYSMVFPEHDEIDESRLIDAVVERLGIPSTRMRIFGGSMLSGGLEFLDAWQMPTPAPNGAFIAALERRAHEEGVSVVLDGEGGDELFGADPFLAASLLRAGRPRAAWEICRRVPGFGFDPPLRHVLRAYRLLAFRGNVPYRLQRMRRGMRKPEELVPSWLSAAGAVAFADHHDPWSWKRASAPLWWAHLSETLTNGRERAWVFDYLRQVGALGGVDRRHPLLDLDLVELVLRLPPEYAYDPRFDRALVRRAMAGRLPDEVRERAGKSRFTGLMRSSLLEADLPLLRSLLQAPDAEVGAFVDRDRVDASLDAAAASSQPTAFAIEGWRLAMAEAWLRSQADPEFAGRLLETASLQPARLEFVTLPGPGRPFSTLTVPTTRPKVVATFEKPTRRAT